MKEYLLHLLILLKKQLTNPVYLCLLIIIPAGLFAVRHFSLSSEEESRIRAGFFIEQDLSGNDSGDMSSFADKIRQSLKEVSGRLEFIEYNDAELMKSNTARAFLECSYIFTDGLFSALCKDSYKDTIIVFTSPQTILADLTNELVFASVFRAFGDNVLYLYADNNASLLADNSVNDFKAVLKTQFEKQLKGNDTFSLDFQVYQKAAAGLKYSLSGSEVDTQITGSTAVTKSAGAIRGVSAILLFLCTMLSCVDYRTEAEKGTFRRLSSAKQFELSSCYFASWLIPAILSVLLCLSVSGSLAGFALELSALAAYLLLLFVFGAFLNLIIKKSLFITALIPVLIIGSLIFCPIIIRLSAVLPAAGFFEKLFLPYYYLRFF